MQNFVNLFQQNSGRAMTKNELLNAVREDIRGELEAINEYSTHINVTDNIEAKKVWEDIVKEEQVHVGELFELLFYLDPISADKFVEGRTEAKEIMGISPMRKNN